MNGPGQKRNLMEMSANISDFEVNNTEVRSNQTSSSCQNSNFPHLLETMDSMSKLITENSSIEIHFYDKTELFALHSQAKFGKNVSPAPSVFKMSEFLLWTAWLKKSEISRDQAAKDYILKVAEILESNKIEVKSENAKNLITCLKQENYEKEKNSSALRFLTLDDFSSGLKISKTAILVIFLTAAHISY